MDRKMVNFIKEQYPPGTRIRLNSMEDPYHPILPGTEGEVEVRCSVHPYRQHTGIRNRDCI